MNGPSIEDVENQGIIPRMVRTVFNRIEEASENMEFNVKVSYCEIYKEKIKDLMNPQKTDLRIREEKDKGIYIEGITETYVSSDDEVYNIMKRGIRYRATAVTKMNDSSSRSHSMF